MFAQICAACHGADGKGNQALGAPNLTDKIWLYGGSEATIIETHQQGSTRCRRTTPMPAHKDLLGAGEDPAAGRVRLGPVERGRARAEVKRRRAGRACADEPP